jgi:alpha-1,6-mannosyltransferase
MSTFRRPETAFVVCGVVLAAGTAVLAVLSSQFEYGSPMLERPIRTAVAMLMGMGVVYLFAIHFAQRVTPTRRLAVWIVLVGLAMRMAYVPSTPILENDFYRYLWDGAVTAHGINPYRIPPLDALDEADHVPSKLHELGRESGVVLKRVNHAEVATIYPPVAQAVFAAAHLAAPWSLVGWRIVLLAFEMLSLVLIWRTLRTFGWPPGLAAVYWWNPLVAKEVLNSGHMDALLVPPLLLLFHALARNRAVGSMFLVGLASAIKVWPVLLAPLVVRNLRAQRYRIAGAVLIGTGTILALYVPVIAAAEVGWDSGFLRYAEEWENNDALFMLVHAAAASSLRGLGNASPETAGWVARLAAAGLVTAVALGCAVRRAGDSGTLAGCFLWIATALFMLSPTQFPWYYLWLMPFLVFVPRPSLLLLTALLPLYYLRFRYRAAGNVDVFDQAIVWIEFGPVLLLLAWELLRGWRPSHMRDIPTHA